VSNTIHVILEPNGKGGEVQQIVELRPTAEEREKSNIRRPKRKR
jgi:hypothetical protein